MKKILVAMFMGLFIFAGAASLNVCNASGTQDMVQWYFQRSTMQASIANTIAVSQDVVAYFMEEGYAPRDIVMAGLLAGQNNSINVHVSNINEILAKKTSNNSWQDVANAMGVDQATFKQCDTKANEIV
ncbi:MAG: hypothetical protein H6Q75_146 [Firmicutes bacterium]|nr:hypothetical protein [Bacillota bacterium]